MSIWTPWQSGCRATDRNTSRQRMSIIVRRVFRARIAWLNRGPGKPQCCRLHARCARMLARILARCSGFAAIFVRCTCEFSSNSCSLFLARSADLRCSLGDSPVQSIPSSLRLRYANGEIRLDLVGQIHPRSAVSRESASAMSRPVHRAVSILTSRRRSQIAPICPGGLRAGAWLTSSAAVL